MKKDSDNQLFFDFDAPVPPPEPELLTPEHALAAYDEEREQEINTVLQPVSEEESAAPEPMAEAEPSPEPAIKKRAENNSEHQLYQAVLAHLIKEGVTGAALHVPCRHHKFKASVAAYFSNAERRCNQLQSCILVDIYSKRNQCIPECAGSRAVAAELAELRIQRTAMEEQIKLDEPELRVEDELFDEFRSFDFTRSCNKDYHRLCRRIASLQQSLFKGTRMEQLARSAVADYLIIAVPENLINENELPDNWGLWYITTERKIKVIKMPEKQVCSELSRSHMVQNIGRCALQSVLFANGIKVKSDNSVRFTRIPRARRK